MAQQSSHSFVDEMAAATGVAVADVKKILSKLGLERVEEQAVASNGGKPVKVESARVAFKIGRSTIIV